METTSNPNKTLIICLIIALVLNLVRMFVFTDDTTVIAPPIDNTKYEHRIDSLERENEKKDGFIEALKIGIEAKAETVYVNQKKVEKDVNDISKYSDIKRLYDSLYSAR